MSRIAIVGAGLAGLYVARRLAPLHDVTLFEKSRGPGGRIATRRADDWYFDHGAQFFTAHTAEFQAFLEPLLADGAVAHWPARFAEIIGSQISSERRWTEEYPHYVGVPGMNAIGKYLAEDLDLRTASHVQALTPSADGWLLEVDGADMKERYDWVIVTAPAAQTASLLPADSSLLPTASGPVMKSCFALMLGFDQAPDLDFDAALVRGRDISWISVNSNKPGRNPKGSIVVHATNAWADANLERPLDEVRDHMLAEFRLATGLDPASAEHVDVQRWRYANIDKQAPAAAQIDEELCLGICGDWLVRGRVESAFTSADRLLAKLELRLLPAGQP